MTIALDIIKGALRLIGAIATGETPSAPEAQDALSTLNDILESWGLERLTVYTRQEQQFQTVAGQQEYRLGPGGDWDGARPVSIISAVVHVDGLDRDLQLISLTRWDEIQNRALQNTPCALVYRPDFPQGLVRLWPAPQGALQITLASALPFTPLTNAAQQLVMPPGYARALRYALAVELAPEYGAELRADVIAIARDSKADIKRANIPDPPELEVVPRRLSGQAAFLAGDIY
jgi:hypothetical protein